MGETVEDKVRDASRDELVDELRDRVRRLEQDLDTRDRELSEMRRLLAGALERIPEIEAPRDSPPEPRAARETTTEDDGGTDTPTDRADREKPSSRPRGWWRRVFSFK
jgi:hypothetical protein